MSNETKSSTLYYQVTRLKGGEVVAQFENMNERAYRGLLMKVDSKRFRVEISTTKAEVKP